MVKENTFNDANDKSKAEENSVDEIKSSEDASTNATPSIKGFNQYCIEEIKEENKEDKMVVNEDYFDTVLEPATISESSSDQ